MNGRPSDGLPDAELGVERAPHDLDILNTRSQIYLALGRIDEALRDFDKVLNGGSAGPWIYYGRGRCHELNGAHALAIADYQKALAMFGIYRALDSRPRRVDVTATHTGLAAEPGAPTRDVA